MEPVIKNEIRLDLVFRLIKGKWKKFLLVMFISSVVTYLIMLCIPRYYSVNVMLAPEYGEQSLGGGALGAAASMFGINMNSSAADAIVPEFYPDIIESTDFLVPVMETKVETQDGSFCGTYGEYILKKEKHPWWAMLYAKAKGLFAKKTESYVANGDYKVNPFKLTLSEYNLLQRVSSSIDCSVDEKTGVITLGIKAQDPLVAASMANVVKEQLQGFMTRYRTEKNKVELKHSMAMCDTAYAKYVEAQEKYAEYVDRHQGLSRQAFKVEEERLSGEMQLAFNIYNTLYQQKLLNEAEVQKRTPAFTVLQNATVPVKPAGPKRMVTSIIVAFVSALSYLIILLARNAKARKADEMAVIEL